MADGSPDALILPITFSQLWSSAEDYYSHFTTGTFFRILRFFSFMVALLLTAVFVATQTYHTEMLPIALLVTLAASREGVAFPTMIEALVMEITFESLREAALRLPRVVGLAVSIVGALILGQTSIQSGLASITMVIVVSLSGIASFMAPSFTAGKTIRLLRFPMIILAGTLGYFGIMLGVLAMLVHASSLTSFGVPYLTPFAPLKPYEIGDSLLRRPWSSHLRRPTTFVKSDVVRQSKGPN